MNIDVERKRWEKLPPLLRAGQVLAVATKLGLGERRVKLWMAHHATRSKRPGYAQWSYPTEGTLAALLDMAGVSAKPGVRALAGARDARAGQSEGASGSSTHDPA